jgi:hypothetical protein
MTLNEYINQRDVPVRNPVVQLKTSQVEAYKWLKMGYNVYMRNVVVKRFPEYTYVQVKGDPILYTMDADGNPKNRSVFRLFDKSVKSLLRTNL